MVPSIVQVRPGVAVSIVLKADQPTGRQVQGTVKDVLTSGNHPRGIKVRLVDGRIGRVQRLDTAGAPSGNAQQTESQALGQSNTGTGPASSYRSFRMQSKYTDVRMEDNPTEPPSQYDLSAFVVREAKPKKKGAKSLLKAAPSLEPEPETEPLAATSAKCPVCDAFEGDEAAVAHHVESHFS
ncbi:hypothetical protein MBLNU459_g5150t1 [Dothideomycetes sp. NU459]